MHYFLLGDDDFALMLWLVKPYSRRQLTREERIANYKISIIGGGGGGNTFGILWSKFRVLLLGKGCPRHCFNNWYLAQRAVDLSRGGTGQSTQPADDIAGTANEAAVHVPDENQRNPSKEAKQHQ